MALLLQHAGSPETLPRKLLDLHLHEIAASDAESAQLATALALPRSFDAEIAGVLRGRADPQRDRALVERLAQFSLVLTRRDGTYAYHDTLRHLLLLEWQRDAPDEAQELHGRLVAHYQGRIEQAERLQADLEETGDVIAAAAPPRYARILAEVRGRALGSLREAQYHSLAISAEQGRWFLSTQCERLEAQGRIALCTELTRAAREDLKHLPGATEHAGFLRHVEYWEARVASSQGRYEEVRARLSALEDGMADMDARLRLWTLLLGAGNERALGDRQSARRAVEDAIELVERENPDPHNTPHIYAEMGTLHALWLETEPAREAFTRALDTARMAGNQTMQIRSHLGLAELARNDGDDALALTQSFMALDLAQTGELLDASAYRWLLEALLGVLANASPWHLPTLRAELAVLRVGSDDEEPRAADSPNVALEAVYAHAARVAGLMSVAGETIDRVERLVAEGVLSEAALSEIGYVAGGVRSHQGRYREAAEKYMCPGNEDPGWERAANLTNSGLAQLYFDPSLAEASLRAATAEWEQIGHPNYLALSRAYHARSLCALGRLDEAERNLRLAEAVSEELVPEVLADVLEARAALDRVRGEFAAAAESEAGVAALYAQLKRPREHARALSREAGALGMAAEWELAAARADQAAVVWRDMARRDTALADRPDGMTAADLANADGVRELVRRRDESTLHAARSAFTRALEQVPDDPWYSLNLAYACARLGDWTEAEAALDTVIRKGDPWNSEVLIARRDEFAARRAESGQDEPTYSRVGTAVARWFRQVVGAD
jgi:tetratricopeptide (TPR) repeat protein